MKNREAGLQVRDGQKSFRASRIDQPNHPLGAEAVLGHQHEAGQHQADILPRKEDQRCPGPSCTVWTASPTYRHCKPKLAGCKKKKISQDDENIPSI